MGLGPLAFVALALGAAAWASKASASPSSSSSSSSAASFRAALLERARYDLGGRVVETGPNDGPIVRQYLAAVGLGPGQAWSAAAAWVWLHDAALRVAPGVLERFPRTGSPAALGEAAKRAGLWLPVAAVRAGAELPEPGSVAIWEHHAGLVEDWWLYTMGERGRADTRQERWFHALEADGGTQGDRVTRIDRPLADPGLLGFVVFR